MEGCNSYELVSGERRCRAAKMAGLKTISVVVYQGNRSLAAHQALVENIQRVDLNPLEVAVALQTLMDEFSLSASEVGEQVGKKRSTVSNYLRLLELPRQIQASLQQEMITMSHAKAILSLPNEEQQMLLYREIVDNAFSVRQSEAAARRITQKSKKKRLVYNERDFYLEQLGEKIQEKLGTKVVVQGQGKKGRITIHYHNLDDLERLLEQLDVTL